MKNLGKIAKFERKSHENVSTEEFARVDYKYFSLPFACLISDLENGFRTFKCVARGLFGTNQSQYNMRKRDLLKIFICSNNEYLLGRACW